MFSRKNSLRIVIILLLLLTAVGVSAAQSDNYSFGVSSGNNTLSLNKIYNGTYVTSADGLFVGGTSNEEYYREIIINSSKTIDNAKIDNITIPTHPSMNANRSDLRFIDVSTQQVLPYYISGNNSTHVKVSVKANVTAGNNSILAVWGNSSLPAMSNRSSVYLYVLPSGGYYFSDTTLYSGNNTNQYVSYRVEGSNYEPDVGYVTGSSVNANRPFLGYSVVKNIEPMQLHTITLGDVPSGYSKLFNDIRTVNSVDFEVTSYITSNGNISIQIETDSLGSWDYSKYISSSPFMRQCRFSTNGNGGLWIYEAEVYNSTTVNSVSIGDVHVYSATPVSLSFPQTDFNSLSYNASSAGSLNFTINYTPHITNWSVLPNQPAGTLNFSFKPNPTTAFFTWQVSDTAFFTNIITSGSTSGAVINGTGFVNMNITDYTNLTSGQYYLRLKSGDASNSTVFAMNEVNISDTVSLTFHLVDGVTGTLIAPPLTGNTTLFPTASIGNTTANVTYTGLVRSWLVSENAVSIVSGGSVQNRSIYTNNSTNTRAIFTVNNLTIGQPIILSFTAASNYTPQNYTITPTSEMLNLPYLELAIARSTYGIANNTYGIVHDEYGQPIQNGSVIIKNATTGNIIQAYPIAAGGQYAYNNTNTTGGNHFTFSAEGFQQVAGILGSGKQDILMPRAHNISIRLFDADSAAPIMRFTTYLGDSQIIRSTDSGVVTYTNVSSGSYQVILQADGYTQVSRQINVSDYQKTFNITISKTENITVWDEPNYVTFNIIDQFGESVRNADVAVQTLDGRTIFSRTLEGSSSFVVELNRTTNYKITVSKPSENIYQSLTIYGSSLSAYMYISVSRSVQGALDLFNGTYISFDAPKNQFIVTATATDSRITDLYFTETDVKYSIQGSAVNGSLGAPTITKPSANTIVATWNISDLYQNGGVILSSNITIGSNQTGNQTMRVKNVMIARENGTGDQSLKLDIGIDKEMMQWVSVFLIIATALITSSAGIPYLSTLAPIVVYYILWWAGWITLPTGVVILFAIGLIVVAYDMIKKSKM